jgi:hypothetical protein
MVAPDRELVVVKLELGTPVHRRGRHDAGAYTPVPTPGFQGSPHAASANTDTHSLARTGVSLALTRMFQRDVMP